MQAAVCVEGDVCIARTVGFNFFLHTAQGVGKEKSNDERKHKNDEGRYQEGQTPRRPSSIVKNVDKNNEEHACEHCKQCGEYGEVCRKPLNTILL